MSSLNWRQTFSFPWLCPWPFSCMHCNLQVLQLWLHLAHICTAGILDTLGHLHLGAPTSYGLFLDSTPYNCHLRNASLLCATHVLWVPSYTKYMYGGKLVVNSHLRSVPPCVGVLRCMYRLRNCRCGKMCDVMKMIPLLHGASAPPQDPSVFFFLGGGGSTVCTALLAHQTVLSFYRSLSGCAFCVCILSLSLSPTISHHPDDWSLELKFQCR